MKVLPKTFVATLGALLLAGCSTMPAPAPLALTGDPVTDARIRRDAAPAADRILWDYRLGLAALRAGDLETARQSLDTGIAAAGGIWSGDPATRRARSLFGREDSKTFLGEPYERIMAFYYRAILFWKDGQPDNARACYLTGLLLDTDPENEQWEADFVLLDHLRGIAESRMGLDPAGAFSRARANARMAPPPEFDREHNVLVFAEFGRGPEKFGAGRFGEQLRFREQRSRVRSARLEIGDQIIPLNPIDDLHFQATTRGGRVMDHVLAGQAVFKETTATVGDVGVIAGLGVLNAGDGNRGNRNLGAGLIAAGILSHLISSAAQPQADLRTWDDLPRFLSFASLRLPPGTHSGTVTYLDASGAVIDAFTESVSIEISPGRDTVVLLSRTR